MFLDGYGSSSASMSPFSRMLGRYTVQALLVFTGFVCVMAWEGVKWIAGLFG